MKTEYSITIMRHSDDDTTELVDRYITADQAIDLMLTVNALPEDETEPVNVEKPKDTDKGKTGKGKKEKKQYACKNCGVLGHTAKTCSKDKVEAKTVETSHEDTQEQRMRKLYKGLSQEEKEIVRMVWEGAENSEIYQAFPSKEVYRIKDLIEAYGPWKDALQSSQ